MSHFVTCDLLDDHPERNIHVLSPYIDGKRLYNFGGVSSFGGQIVTVKCFEDNSKVKELLNSQGNGKILLVDGGGSIRCALLGDMIGKSAVDNGWAGVIVYGCVRDVDVLATLPLGVMALASTPKKSVRQGLGETHVSVSFGGVTFDDGAWVYADNNGVIVSDTALL